MTYGEVVLAVPIVLISPVFAWAAASEPASGALTLGVTLLLGGNTWWLFLRDNAYSARGRYPYLTAVAIAASAILGTIVGALTRVG